MIKLEFWSDCSLGPIYYGTDEHFIIYLDAKVQEAFFEETEVAQIDNDGNSVPSFRRQVKRYKIITQEQPEHMVDAFYRMKLNDYIQLTWENLETDYIYNITVEHEWFEESKTTAIVTLTFDMDEKLIVGGCCIPLTAVEISVIVVPPIIVLDGVPLGLLLTTDSDTVISGTFTIGSTNQDGHKVYVSADDITYTLNQTLTGTDNTFETTGLTEGTLYYFKVTAYKGTSESGASNISNTSTIVENFGTRTGKNNTDFLDRKITGNGWVQFDTTGLVAANIIHAILILNSYLTNAKTETSAEFTTVVACMYYSTAGNLIRCYSRGVEYISAVAFSAGQRLRIRRSGNTIYFEYSVDEITWTVLTTASYSAQNVLYTSILWWNNITTRTVNNVKFGGNVSSVYGGTYAEENLGDKTLAGTGSINLYRVLSGDGYIKAYATGLALTNVREVLIFLHNSPTFPATIATLTASSFWFNTDQKIHADPYSGICGVVFNNSQVMRIRRTAGTIYWEYSNDDITFSVITSHAATGPLAGPLYAGVWFFTTGNKQLKTVKVSGMKSLEITTQSSGDYRFRYLPGFSALNKVVLYTHGAGEDEDAPVVDALKIPTINAFLKEGWGVISALAAGENWGNQASLTDYYALIAWAKTIYNFTNVVIFAQSMGGCSGLQLFMTDSQFNKLLGIYPVCNLRNMFDAVTYKAAIKTAFNFSNDADYATATAGHDPMLLSGASLGGRKMELVASAADTVVSKTNNTTLYNTNFGALATITVITATGNHGDTSHFSPLRDVMFLDS